MIFIPVLFSIRWFISLLVLPKGGLINFGYRPVQNKIQNGHCYHMVSHNIISYHSISYHVISHYIISYYIISYHITSYHMILNSMLSYSRLVYFIIFCRMGKFQFHPYIYTESICNIFFYSNMRHSVYIARLYSQQFAKLIKF